MNYIRLIKRIKSVTDNLDQSNKDELTKIGDYLLDVNTTPKDIEMALRVLSNHIGSTL